MATTQGTAFWRQAGLNFLQYQHISASAVRSALKDSAKAAAKSRDVVHYRVRPWEKGVRSDATVVSNPLQRKAEF